MPGFLNSFDIMPFLSSPLSHPSVPPVPRLRKQTGSSLSDKFLASTFAPGGGGEVKTQHLAESSLVLFHKLRQQRSLAVLEALTLRLHAQVYQHTYGDKESYWLACELAGADYSFSPYGPRSVEPDTT